MSRTVAAPGWKIQLAPRIGIGDVRVNDGSAPTDDVKSGSRHNRDTCGVAGLAHATLTRPDGDDGRSSRDEQISQVRIRALVRRSSSVPSDASSPETGTRGSLSAAGFTGRGSRRSEACCSRVRLAKTHRDEQVEWVRPRFLHAIAASGAGPSDEWTLGERGRE